MTQGIEENSPVDRKKIWIRRSWPYALLAICLAIILVILDLVVLNQRIERYPMAKQAGSNDVWVLVGSDSRFDAPNMPEFISSNQVFSERADLIFLIRKEGDTIKVLSLPRDIDVQDEQGKLRLTLGFLQGASGFSNLLCKNFSIPVDHLVTVTITGFIDTVDLLGGVTLDVPFKFKDKYTESNFEAGKQHLSGRDALKIVRARHQEIFQNGKWVPIDDKAGAQSRINMSKQVMEEVLKQLKSVRNPITLQRLAWSLSEHTRIDTHTDLLELRKFISGKLEFSTLDTVVTSKDALHRKVTNKGKKQLKDLGFTGKCRTEISRSQFVPAS